MVDSTSKQLVVIRNIIDDADLAQQLALYEWGQELLAIRKSEQSVAQKARAAIRATAHREIIWPLVRKFMTQLKKHGWDNRSWTARLGVGAAAVTVLTLGGQGAGIAALGTAIGVPLWVVFGAGVSFAVMLVDELGKAIRNNKTSSSQTSMRKDGGN